MRYAGSRCLMALVLILMATYNQPLRAGAEFNPTTPPTKAEWTHFNKLTEARRTSLWNYQSARGHKTLGAWAWQWRMGWIRHCGTESMAGACQTILKDGLKDEAMVVRAEAATVIGAKYEGRENKDVVSALAAAYKDPRNSRNGSPLFVCDRILEALAKINGNRATRTAEKLAKSHPQTANYWAKLTKKKI